MFLHFLNIVYHNESIQPLLTNAYVLIFAFHLCDRDNYGFVTYYDTKDAFTAIENGGKLRKPDELPFDLCFGGRRQFCKASYADLGRTYYFGGCQHWYKF